MKILGLDVRLPAGIADSYPFAGMVSIFEYDIVMWDPENTWTRYKDQYSYRDNHLGLPKMLDGESVSLMGDISRRKKEFQDFLDMGRTLVVFSASPQELYINARSGDYPDLAQSSKKNSPFRLVDILSALPYGLRGVGSVGEAMTPLREDFASAWRPHSDDWFYRCILDSYPGNPLMVVSGTNKVVGSIDETPSRGIIVNLPYLDTIGDEEASHADEGDNNGEQESSSDEAMTAVIEWLTQLGREESELPAWAEALKFPESSSRSGKLTDLERQVQSLEERISKIKAEEAKDNKWKQLVVATGNMLEQCVQEAFIVLGFEILGLEAGRKDLHLKFGDRLAVVEIKGVKKSSSEQHAAQLEKWVSEAFTQTGKHHKGILVVNSWRERPLEKREKTFPDQMLKYSESRDHCLISGMQLLSMVRAVLTHRKDPQDIAETILDCIGVLPAWDDPNEVFTGLAPAGGGR